MDGFILLWFWFVGLAQQILQFSFACRYTATKPKLWHYLIYIAFAQISDLLGIALKSSFCIIFLNILFLYGVTHYLLRNKHLISAIVSVLTISIMQLSWGLTNTIISLALPYVEPPNPLSWLLHIIAAVVALLLFYYFGVLIVQKFTLEKDVSNQYLIMLLAPILFLWAIEFYVVNKDYGNVVTTPFPVEPRKHIELLIMQLLGFGTTISSLYAYQKLGNSFKTKSRLALLEQETHAQRIYVTEAKMRYEQTISFRHDVKNHFLILDGLLKSGQASQAQLYLKELQFVTDDLSFIAYTGNAIIDVLLCSKTELARQNDIQIDFLLTLPKTCKVSDMDFCVVFSNALDNAIVACSQVKGLKTISITGEQQGDFYFLEFTNSCAAEPLSKIKFGTGLNNVKTVAEKYGGAVTIEHFSEKFCLDVLLNIS